MIVVDSAEIAIRCTKCGEPWENNNHLCNAILVLELQEKIERLMQERTIPASAYGMSLSLSKHDITYAARRFRERGIPHVAECRIRMGELEREMTAQEFEDAIFNNKTPLPVHYWKLLDLARRVITVCELWRDNLGQPSMPAWGNYVRCIVCNCENGPEWRSGEWHLEFCIVPQIKKALAELPVGE